MDPSLVPASSSTESTAAPAEKKRKRSNSTDAPPQPAKVSRLSNHLQINYLARQFEQDLPLISPDDAIPSILQLITEYEGVLHRHESMAGNVGARPLGPILIKRFERLFDGPPRILKCHGKEGTTVTWFDIVEFAKNKPEQFNLEKMRDGVKVCQFYTKQCRVEISEEEFLLISSGMPQRMIPPQPIIEDEEKELGTLEILEKRLAQIVHLADQVSARARQLNHRLRARENAIVNRREREQEAAYYAKQRACEDSPLNGTNGAMHSPTSSFVAVNSRQPLTSIDQTNGSSYVNGTRTSPSDPNYKYYPKTDPAALEEEILRASNSHNRPSFSGSDTQNPTTYNDYGSRTSPSAAHAQNSVPSSSSAGPSFRSVATLLSEDGPYKLEMVRRMDRLQRGERVIPPCDRCRRLHMDCLKNLTACIGCTKKHAKCCWKDVRESELIETAALLDVAESLKVSAPKKKKKGSDQGVTDEELLGEEIADDEVAVEDTAPSNHTIETTVDHATTSESGGHGELDSTPPISSTVKVETIPSPGSSSTIRVVTTPPTDHEAIDSVKSDDSLKDAVEKPNGQNSENENENENENESDKDLEEQSILSQLAAACREVELVNKPCND